MPLIEDLISQGYLKTERIINAFRKIKRFDFLPQDVKDLAEMNEALPISRGQTISQPLVVAFMIELLEPKEGEKILDIGSGSGWTTALLAEIVGEEGRVIAIELVPELKQFGEKNTAKYDFVKSGRVEFICGDGSKGYPNIVTRPELAEGFDKILASASITSGEESGGGAKNLPFAWREQLKTGGRIVTPIGNSIWLFIKKDKDNFEEIEYPGFVFVPLITKNS